MFASLLAKIFGSRNQRLIKTMYKKVEIINRFEATISQLTDEQLAEKTNQFKQKIKEGVASLDDLLPEAFAVVREASKRVLGMRHYDVQLIGGMVLHQGKIAEMRTGEGKTLVASLAVYLNALSGKGVHVVTVNDYLAKRDGTELAKLYNFLGLSVGIIVSGMDLEDKKAAYRADITYGTNNEFGFDHLRTNMALTVEDRLQPNLHFAIVDEVDSILIDEARTPLIISGAADTDSDLYVQLNDVIPKLQPEKDGVGDFTVDEKTKQAGLTDQGHDKVEQILQEKGLLKEGDDLYSPHNLPLFHALNACLRAHHLFHNNVDYIVRNDEVIIVDEFTGRTMEGRRWSDGLHQAIEVKEGVSVKQETQTLASITYQNFFRMYEKLAGMTGTADTEAFEFQDIYGLETVVIPTNKPVARIDYTDVIYLKQKGKYQAIIEDIKQRMTKGQPVLLGTASIETSELLSDLLTKAGIEHNVLNAKQHAREAEIIAQAGKKGQVTIATNMAGRGTDIVLGGSLKAQIAELGENPTQEQIAKVTADWQKQHDEVIQAGGLHVIGAERHESRRIDNQLRGRSGRQGDPGSSRFYVALDDNLVRIFAGERMGLLMQRLGMKDDEAIESKMVSRQIEGAQKKVEAHNFDARKSVLEYDDVANEQRKVIYKQRSLIMEADNINNFLAEIRPQVVSNLVDYYLPANQVRKSWDLDGLNQAVLQDLGLEVAIDKWLDEDNQLVPEQIKSKLLELSTKQHQQKVALVGEEILNQIEKYIALQTIDHQWKHHLQIMDMLRQSIWLRSRAQKDPKREYQKESFELFSDLLTKIQQEIIRSLSRLSFQQQTDENLVDENPTETPSQNQNEDDEAEKERLRLIKTAPIGRNEPCSCGSGKKYKHCCGRLN